MNFFEQLKSFSEHWALEDLIALAAVAKVVAKEFTDRKADMPNWLVEQMETLEAVIRGKMAAQQAKKIRDLKLKIEGYKDRSERKADAQNELEALLAQK